MTAVTLYEANEHLVALLDTLDMCETDEARAECEAAIQQAAETHIRKVDSFCRFLSLVESQAELAAKEIDRLKLRRDALQKTADRLEQYAIRLMQSQGLTKLEGDTAKLSLRSNVAAVEITDEAAVPPQFKTITQKISCDKRAIKKAIDSGADVPGADLRFGSVTLIRK